jgi:hypothetical protein
MEKIFTSIFIKKKKKNPCNYLCIGNNNIKVTQYRRKGKYKINKIKKKL